jgi:hypothetical protein
MKYVYTLLLSIFILSCSKEIIPSFDLTVTSLPLEGGSSSPSMGKFESGSEVAITATPNKFYEFSGWTGSYTSKDNPLKIQIDFETKLIANFNFLDSDKDGIPDKDDLDNNTRKGVPVDKSGIMINPIYLDANGVTIKCFDWATIGDKGELNGKVYEVVSETKLRTLIKSNSDISFICTSKIESLKQLFANSEFNGDISR